MNIIEKISSPDFKRLFYFYIFVLVSFSGVAAYDLPNDLSASISYDSLARDFNKAFVDLDQNNQIVFERNVFEQFQLQFTELEDALRTLRDSNNISSVLRVNIIKTLDLFYEIRIESREVLSKNSFMTLTPEDQNKIAEIMAKVQQISTNLQYITEQSEKELGFEIINTLGIVLKIGVFDLFVTGLLGVWIDSTNKADKLTKKNPKNRES